MRWQRAEQGQNPFFFVLSSQNRTLINKELYPTCQKAPGTATTKGQIFRFSPVLLQLLKGEHTQDESTTVGAWSHLRAATEVKLVREEDTPIAKLCPACEQKATMEFGDQGKDSSPGALSLHIEHLNFVPVSSTKPLAPSGQGLCLIHIFNPIIWYFRETQ